MMVEVDKNAMGILEEQFQSNKKNISRALEEVNSIGQNFNRMIEEQYDLIRTSPLNREYSELADLSLLNRAFSNLQDAGKVEINRNLSELQSIQNENKALYSKEVSRLEEE